MKTLKYTIPVLIATLLVSGIVWAAAVFPGALDNFVTGDVLEAEDVNAIQATIGITNSAVTTSHDYIIRHDLLSWANATSTYFPLSGGVVIASSTIIGDFYNEGNATTTGNFNVGGDLTITGTTTATGHAIVPLVPWNSNQAASKEYVDTAGGEVLSYFLSDQASIFGNTFNMEDKDTGESQSTLASTSMASGNAQILWSWISSSTPAFTTIEAGVITGHFHFQRTGGNRDITPYWELYASSTDETQTLIALSEDGDIVGDTASTDDIHAARATDYDLTAGDNIILILYADIAAGGSPTDITLTMEGTEDSRLDIETPGAGSLLFIRQDGTTGLTDNWDAGAYVITASTFIGALTGNADTATDLREGTTTTLDWWGSERDNTHITWTASGFEVDDDFLLNTGDTGTWLTLTDIFTGVDAVLSGGINSATGTITDLTVTYSTTTGSLVIPVDQGIDEEGEIEVDKTSGTYRYHDGTSARVLGYWEEKCITMASSTWQNIATSTIVWRPYKAITIVQTSCDNGGTLIDQGTSTIYFSDGTNDLDAMTCGYTQSKDTSLSNATWTADEAFIWTLTKVEGTPNFFNACIYYTITAD